MTNHPNKPSDPSPQVESFRAYLHTVITAEQFGKNGRLAALPGPQFCDYCQLLAALPDNALARELAAPVWAVLEQINEAAIHFYRPIYHKQITDPAQLKEQERVLEQLDLALALILRRLPGIARFRAQSTKSEDLLLDVISGLVGYGSEAADLIRRWQAEFAEDICDSSGAITDGGFPEIYAWETYQRVEALDRLVDEFPGHIRLAARTMHGWPMLAHRHNSNRKRFQELAARLDLGVAYPLDASEGARFRPDSPMVRYLDPLIYRLDHVYNCMVGRTFQSLTEEQKFLRMRWNAGLNERFGDNVVELLRGVPQLPPLTKATSNQWAEKVVVPVILATDASDWKNCTEPALRRIAKQAGVKSRATFKSRLLSAVSSTLRRLARPPVGATPRCPNVAVTPPS